MLQIEPHANGPLFVELHALLRIRREEQQLATWQPNNPSKPSGTYSQYCGWIRPFGSGSRRAQNGSPTTPANHQVQLVLWVDPPCCIRIQKRAIWQPNNPSKPSGTASVVGRSVPRWIRIPGGQKMSHKIRKSEENPCLNPNF
jgi:hypothetical protein